RILTMLKLWKLSRKCRDLAQDARAIAGRRDVLYQGTRHPRSVLRMKHAVRVVLGRRSGRIYEVGRSHSRAVPIIRTNDIGDIKRARGLTNEGSRDISA